MVLQAHQNFNRPLKAAPDKSLSSDTGTLGCQIVTEPAAIYHRSPMNLLKIYRSQQLLSIRQCRTALALRLIDTLHSSPTLESSLS